ncbi:glycoside hydrolase family 47 protein [Agrocybe pediades]|nr:glycoside hydrolase family 47 protein [Agrocybe pediades]
MYLLFYITAPRKMLSALPDYLVPGVEEGDLDGLSWGEKAQKVKEAFLHAYHGYEKYAAPGDELKPLADSRIDNFNAWGVTIFDSLDTMLLMGLNEEYERALEVVRAVNFTETPYFVPFFETSIRYLGGLLSAYALSHDELHLQKAEELAQRLDPVFNTPTGLPYFGVNPKTGGHKGPDIGILAEIASLQVEYTYLAKLTGKKEYFKRSQGIMEVFASADLKHTAGMLPVQWNITDGTPSDKHLSVGAQADSTHEYLLKLYLLTGKTDKTSLEMYLRATTYIITNLLYLSPTRNLLYVTDTTASTFGHSKMPTHIFEHLSCFLPGLLALGADTLPLDNLTELGINWDNLGNETTYGHAGTAYQMLRRHSLKDLHMWAAEGIAQTCWATYADQPTGLGPDEVVMDTVADDNSKTSQNGEKSATFLWIDAVEKWRKSGRRGIVPGLREPIPVKPGKVRDYVFRRPGYLLRPETVESLYIMWKVTGDKKWRDKGWAIFKAIEKETRTSSGYASLQRVDSSPARKMDSMPSYFLAETLKYLYLMFLEDDPIRLDRWVFNTEAHPLPAFEWSAEERKRFGV